MKHLFFFIVLILLLSCNHKDIEVNYPFPQNVDYKVDVCSSKYSTTELNDFVKDFYDKWKKKYVKECDDMYYIDYDEGNVINVSEGLGYGMMIMAYMAGYDNEAKEYFDGMYRFSRKFPSSINNDLMAWEQIEGCITNPDGGDDAASDGDIDIAYALLLADKQWGSAGEINYRQEALKIISAIKKDEINSVTNAVKLGDWATQDDENYFYATRTSDFILDHFRAFSLTAADDVWDKVVLSCLNVMDSIQQNYSEQTGLMPDFVQYSVSYVLPVSADFLESEYDGQFYYNACRVPWRLTVDYLLYADSNSYKIVHKINSWIIENTNADADKIAAGYYLSGTAIHNDYQDICFYGAFAVSAMLENNQKWFDDLLDKMINEDITDNGYFPNTLKMLYLLTVSKNIWKP